MTISCHHLKTDLLVAFDFEIEWGFVVFSHFLIALIETGYIIFWEPLNLPVLKLASSQLLTSKCATDRYHITLTCMFFDPPQIYPLVFLFIILTKMSSDAYNILFGKAPLHILLKGNKNPTHVLECRLYLSFWTTFLLLSILSLCL